MSKTFSKKKKLEKQRLEHWNVCLKWWSRSVVAYPWLAPMNELCRIGVIYIILKFKSKVIAKILKSA
jgi:hypothetical protein